MIKAQRICKEHNKIIGNERAINFLVKNERQIGLKLIKVLVIAT